MIIFIENFISELKNRIMDTIQVIPMVKREMLRKHQNISGVARKLNLNQSSVNGMLRRSSMHVQRLIEFSDVLQYNFFREIAAMLPYAEPADEMQIKDQERIKELEMEVRILRQTLKDATSR